MARELRNIMKKILIGFTAFGLMLLVLGAAATRNRYVGTFVGDGVGVTNSVATYVSTSPLTNKVSAANITAGTVASAFDGNAITNLGATGGPWVRTNDSRAITNLAGDLTLQASSTFLQMNATGSGTGYKYFDFYNGGSALSLRRKTDNGATVLDVPFTIAAGNFTFGIPVELPTNSLASWPVAPTIGGASCFVNSNGTVYLLTSLPATLTWAATNKIAP